MLGAVMGRIDPKETGRAGRVRRVRLAALVAVALAASACGDDPGGPFEMPAGSEFDSVATDRVLAVVESQNQCRDIGDCLPNPASPCDLGDGNRRGLAIYRLGPSGRLVSATGDRAGARPEEIIPLADNPRRVIAHPNDPTLLYVATVRRVQVIRLVPGGGSTCIDQTPADDEVDPDLNEDLDVVDIVIDPRFGTNGVLYLAGERGDRVDAYDIAADGTLPPLPSSCIVGSGRNEQYRAVSPLNDTLFATGGRDRIEIYARVDGQFPDAQEEPPTPTPTDTPDPNQPTPMPTDTPDPNQPTPTPMPSDTPTPTGPTPVATPTAAPTCIDARFVTASISSLGAGLVTDMEFLPSLKPDDDSIGDLVVAEELSQRLVSFPIDPNGDIDGRDNGSSSRAGFYVTILRVVRDGVTFLYATAFQEGKTDVFKLGDPLDEGERLRGQPLAKTRADPYSLPVGLAVDGNTGPILYVAQEGLGRVDGFVIRADGGMDAVPTTSTARTRGLDGRSLNLFQNDVVIVPMPLP